MLALKRSRERDDVGIVPYEGKTFSDPTVKETGGQ